MKKRWLLLVLSSILLSSCEKDFLEKKPNQKLLVPNTLVDFRSLLDNIDVMNKTPALNELASDDYYTTDAGLLSYTTVRERNTYIWAADVFEGSSVSDWNLPYEQTLYSNIVLEGLAKVKQENDPLEWKRIKGACLFYRSFALYHLLQTFSLPYKESTAKQDLGVPIRLTANVNDLSTRPTIEQCFNQLINDLTQSLEILADDEPVRSRPTKKAAASLLARVYLIMGDYDNAYKYSDISLSLNNFLLDYNTLVPSNLTNTLPPALPLGNKEINFYAVFSSLSFLTKTLTIVAPELTKSYAEHDLRKLIFYADRGNDLINFKGSYAGSNSTNLFTGLTTAENYLIRAECAIRKGMVEKGIDDLNTLLIKRWRTGQFVPLSNRSKQDALAMVLLERRKELISRGVRWADLRRLNQQPGYEKTIYRSVNGLSYSLLPSSKRYAFPIPINEIIASGIEQNER